MSPILSVKKNRQMKSFMLEALEGNRWASETFNLRFATANEATEYAEHLNSQWNISQPIRVQPSTDTPNCAYTGSLGDKHLVKFDGRA